MSLSNDCLILALHATYISLLQSCIQTSIYNFQGDQDASADAGGRIGAYGNKGLGGGPGHQLLSYTGGEDDRRPGGEKSVRGEVCLHEPGEVLALSASSVPT